MENPRVNKRSINVHDQDKRLKSNSEKPVSTIPTPKNSEVPSNESKATPSNLPNLNAILNEHKHCKAKLVKLEETSIDNFANSVKNVTRNLEGKKDSLVINKFVEDLNYRYEVQNAKKQELLKKLHKLETEAKQRQDHCDKVKAEIDQRKSALKYEIKKVTRDKEKHQEELNYSISTNSKLIEFYKLLSGIEVTQEGTSSFRIRVSWLQEEFVFVLRSIESTFDYELVSHTVPKEKIPQFLLSEINIDKEDAPILLNKIISTLY